MSTEQHKDPPPPPATLPSSSFLCRLEAGGKKEPHRAGICDAAGCAAALWPRCRSDGAEAALQDRSSLTTHWGNMTFLQFTPVHQETLPSFSDLLALWGCSKHHFQTPHWCQPAFWRSACCVTSCLANAPEWPHFALSFLHAHVSSEMSHASNTGTSQLQEILERDAWNVQQRGSWLGKRQCLLLLKLLFMALLCFMFKMSYPGAYWGLLEAWYTHGGWSWGRWQAEPPSVESRLPESLHYFLTISSVLN